MTRLPVDDIVPEILAALRKTSNLVLEALPGAGKTTRVPNALLEMNCGEVLVLEPRRLAARMAARRVASERGEAVGETVGYQVRFEEAAGPKTRLRFLTEGVFTRRLLSDPELRGVGVVVLDEFHERHLDTDLALALLRRLQKTRRRDLRIVVMSATLEAAPVAAFLGDCPVLRSEGKLFDVALEYGASTSATLEEQVAGAVSRTMDRAGDVLVFLPGAAEIRRAARSCEAIARRENLLVVPLHGDLNPAEQDRAVLPAAKRKVILSTNVAESSITIDGVTAVIDSGLARLASDSPWTGLPSLEVGRISKASARQRAGRAGRTAPGRAIRLYSAEDFHRRPDHDSPEIMRRELSQMRLDLLVMGAGDLEWLDAPPAEAWNAAGDLLRRLSAIDAGGTLTAIGRRMAQLPLHPRLARLVVEADKRGAGDGGRAIAAVLSSGERLAENMGTDGGTHGPSDVLLLAEAEWQPNTKRVFEQLNKGRGGRRGKSDDESLLIALLTAFPDRVARRRQADELVLASGGSAILARNSVVRNAGFLIAVDVENRRERGLPLVRLASAIEPEWLLDLFPDRVADQSGVEWNRQAERVDALSALEYEGLTIEESRGSSAPDAALAAELLARKAVEADIGRFVDRDGLSLFLARVEFAASHSPLAPMTMDDVRDTLRGLCDGRRSFAELEAAGLLEALAAGCGRRLDEIAPSRLKLPGGRHTKVHYVAGQTPWVASRLQDFIGMKETPRLAGVPLVVHLLAPNQRPVQMTTDLAGFWERLYPELKRQLSRRYPRHEWP